MGDQSFGSSLSIFDRIEKYRKDVKVRGGTPPEAQYPRNRKRRITLPSIEVETSKQVAERGSAPTTPDSQPLKSLLKRCTPSRSSSLPMEGRNGKVLSIYSCYDESCPSLEKVAERSEYESSDDGLSRPALNQKKGTKKSLSTESAYLQFSSDSNTPNSQRTSKSSDELDPTSERTRLQELEKEIQRLKCENEDIREQMETVAASKHRPADSSGFIKVPSIQRRKGSNAVVHDLIQEVGSIENPRTYVQVFKKFLLSEGQYLNNLLVLVECFVQPFKLLVAYNSSVLPYNRYQSLFLNSEELMRYHKMFHTSLQALRECPEDELVWKFLAVLEVNLPYITVYGPFLASQRQVRRTHFTELLKNREFSQIVSYQEHSTEKSLKELLELPYKRIQNYIEILNMTNQIYAKVPAVQERLDKLIEFLQEQEEMLKIESSEWSEMKKKLNFLEKLSSNSIVPVELFDPKIQLKRHGQLELKIKDKFVPKLCLVFSRYFMLAGIEQMPEKINYRIDAPGMISLCGAKVYSCVDISGQPMADDWKTGLEIDHEAFIIELSNGKESFVLRANKPRNWVKLFHESIEEAERTCNCKANRESQVGMTPIFGGKLAAASEEKLLATLANLQENEEHYLKIFFSIYPAFTSSKTVLHSLIASVMKRKSSSEDGDAASIYPDPPATPHIAIYDPDTHMSVFESGSESELGRHSPYDSLLYSSLPGRGLSNVSENEWSEEMSLSPKEDDVTPMVTPKTSQHLFQGDLFEGSSSEVEGRDELATVSEAQLFGCKNPLQRRKSLSVPDLSEIMSENKAQEIIFIDGSDTSSNRSSTNLSGSDIQFSESDVTHDSESCPSNGRSSSHLLSPVPRLPLSPSPTHLDAAPPSHFASQGNPTGPLSPSKSMGFRTKSPTFPSVSGQAHNPDQKGHWNGHINSQRPPFSTATSLDMTPPAKRKNKSISSQIKGVFKILRRSPINKRKMSENAKSQRLGSIYCSSPWMPGPEEEAQEVIQLVLRVLKVIEYWLEYYYQDFYNNIELKQQLRDFLSEICQQQRCFASSEIFQKVSLIESKLIHKSSQIFGSDIPSLLHRTTKVDLAYVKLFPWEEDSSSAVSLKTPKVDIIQDQTPKTVAQQLTLLQYSLFSAITRNELLNKSWKKNKAPNVSRAIKQGNKTAAWVCTEVLQRQTDAERGAAIEFFIRVALECLEHKDLYSMIMIQSALTSYTLTVLKSSWSHINTRLKEKLRNLRVYSDTAGKCKRMREFVKSKKPPCLPYIGAYLDQIWSLESARSTKSSQGLINFSKMKSLHEIIDSLLHFQSKPYSFTPNIKLIRYIYFVDSYTDDQLYELSLSLKSN